MNLIDYVNIFVLQGGQLVRYHFLKNIAITLQIVKRSGQTTVCSFNGAVHYFT